MNKSFSILTSKFLQVIDVAFCPVPHIDSPLVAADSSAAIESLTLANCGLK